MRKIAVITGSRAEYGLLYFLMKEILSDPALQLQVIVTGSHLCPEFGLTYHEIERDGFIISEKVEMLLSSDTPIGIAKSLGLAIIGIAEALQRQSPDIVVLLGDRYEILAAAQAGMFLKIPIAHLHGGELTLGAIDDAIRHAVTKMSHLHFTSTPEYRNRVIQLGEHPDKVFVSGALCIDNIKRLTLLDKNKFMEEIDFKLGDLNFLVTYHPETLTDTKIEDQINELFSALDLFTNAKIIFTMPNADSGSRLISKMIKQYVLKSEGRATAFISLGQLRYLSAIKHVDVVIGNSSSGIIEVPYFKKPTVNIGNRQKGRLSALSVINCNDDKNSIEKAIKKALSQESLKEVKNPYGDGDAALMIKNVIRDFELKDILKKEFYCHKGSALKIQQRI
ncbi:MAG: UDP-N-acetylglucosamine 2-epimerase (hydrolyzing) [Nitrospirae bacterium]|nr:UDP-N-acetylglucosamine 2-epimerase (hydrolyzing) [Nitrospirota bacterium]